MLDGQHVASSSHILLSFQRLLSYYVFQVNIAFLLFELIAFASISGGNRLVYKSCHVTFIKRISSAMYPLQKWRRITSRIVQNVVTNLNQKCRLSLNTSTVIHEQIVTSQEHLSGKTFGSDQTRHDTVCHFLLLVLQTTKLLTLFTRPIEPFDGKRERYKKKNKHCK